MKNLIFACAAVFACVLIVTPTATAGLWKDFKGAGEIIVGRTSSRTPTTGAINGALSVTGFRTNGGNPEDFSGAFGELPGNTQIFAGTIGFLSQSNSNLGKTISIGTTQWGTFRGTLVEETVSGNTSLTGGLSKASRAFVFVGDFYVGTDTYYDDGPTGMLDSIFTITFTRNSSTVGSIANTSAQWTLNTLGATPIPEPSTTAIFGAGLVGFAVRRMRKHRSRLV